MLHLPFRILPLHNPNSSIASAREEEEESTMKPMVVDYLADMEEQGSTMAMDVDDVDTIDMFGEGPLGGGEHLRLADSDFFNLFQDDFDDSDIN